MSIRIRPLYDYVAAVEMDKETVSAKGIVIPDMAQMAIEKYKVLRVGGGRPTLDGKLLPLETKAGDIVIVSKHAKKIPFKHDGESYVIFKEQEIISIVDPEEVKAT